MSSFLNDENQMIVDAIYTDIADHLLDQWINSNLDEGQYYADKQVALMSGDSYIQSKFNEFYKLTPEDEEYIDVQTLFN